MTQTRQDFRKDFTTCKLRQVRVYQFANVATWSLVARAYGHRNGSHFGYGKYFRAGTSKREPKGTAFGT